MNELSFLNRRGGFLFFIIFIHILTAREGGKWRGVLDTYFLTIFFGGGDA